jgi:hypothetical protein
MNDIPEAQYIHAIHGAGVLHRSDLRVEVPGFTLERGVTYRCVGEDK